MAPVCSQVARLRAWPWLMWAGFALLLWLAPWVFSSSLSMTILSQIGIAIIACLSYNILLGQGGMLSFGHAIYSGFGSFLAIHALNLAGAGTLDLPVSLVPLTGGVAGLLLAVLLGYLCTRRPGTSFAMITLGLGELAFALALMVPEIFGGEGGISANRVIGPPVLGITFGPARQVYYLIAVYCFVCVAAMYALTQTPLGRMLNAVRDNPERVEFVGYDPRHVRYLAFVASGFFAGIAGGLAALHFEIATSEVLGTTRSGAYLLFTFLGGTTVFLGPVIGAILMVLAVVLLSGLTKAWLLYLGLVFMLMVMYAPGGVARLILMNLRVVSRGRMSELLPAYLKLGAATALVVCGASPLIEMLYHQQLDGLGGELRFMGLTWNPSNVWHWAVCAAVLLAGAIGLAHARPGFARQWRQVQDTLQSPRDERKRIVQGDMR